MGDDTRAARTTCHLVPALPACRSRRVRRLAPYRAFGLDPSIRRCPSCQLDLDAELPAPLAVDEESRTATQLGGNHASRDEPAGDLEATAPARVERSY